MGVDYFARVRLATGSRFWVNNPTSEELSLALQHGAMGCTTNPAFSGSLVRRAPHEVLPIVAESLAEGEDDVVVADLVQRRLVARICERFMPLYERSGGREGFVSIQGSPEADHDAGAILEEGRAGRALAPNATPKIPATAPGLAAFEELVAEGCQVIVTEVFSVAQVIATCERWLAVTKRTGVRPPFMLSPITGILGDHLKQLAARDGADVPVADMELAGVLLSRACYRLVRERQYPVLLLYGGARSSLDFSGLAGGGMAATINWFTAEELLLRDGPAETTIDDLVDAAVVERLMATFPEMRRALDPDGLSVADFEGFGPVQHFRDLFVAGWHAVLETIRGARRAPGPVRIQ